MTSNRLGQWLMVALACLIILSLVWTSVTMQ